MLVVIIGGLYFSLIISLLLFYFNSQQAHCELIRFGPCNALRLYDGATYS
jgi:hypothetical protein